MSDSVQPHRWQPTRLPRPWDSPGKNTGVGCHFLLQCMKVKRESEVAQSSPTLSDPMDFSPPGSSVPNKWYFSFLPADLYNLVSRVHPSQSKSERGSLPFPHDLVPLNPCFVLYKTISMEQSLMARQTHRVCDLLPLGECFRICQWIPSRCRRNISNRLRSGMGFPGGSDRREPACNAGDPCSIRGAGRSPEEGRGNPLQYSRLENPMDRGAWRATVHGVAESQTRLKRVNAYTYIADTQCCLRFS